MAVQGARRCASSARRRRAPLVYWYAKASSPIKTLQDTNGRTIAYSTNGSSTQSIVRAFIDEFKLTANGVIRNPSVTLTAVMTDQVDVGWASPPFGLKEQDAGHILSVLVPPPTHAALVRGQTIRGDRGQCAGAGKTQGRHRPLHGIRGRTTTCIPIIHRQVLKDYAALVQVSEP